MQKMMKRVTRRITMISVIMKKATDEEDRDNCEEDEVDQL
jgi:hypothetical protein